MTIKVDNTMERLQRRSIQPIENPVAIRDYILESSTLGKKMTLYNWECPPRFLDTNNSKKFVNYNVDLDTIFKGIKIDDYTELPRVVEKFEDEKEILNFLNSLGINYRFVKLIADTNAYYLTPETINILSKEQIQKKFREFKRLVQEKLKEYPAETYVYLFTDLIEKYNDLYNQSFKQAITLLTQDPTRLLSDDTFQEQLQRTQDHIGMTDSGQIIEFSIKTIASYGAEGIVFNQLSKSAGFSNCVWLNNHEVDKRTVSITNCLRKVYNIESLPMIFL